MYCRNLISWSKQKGQLAQKGRNKTEIVEGLFSGEYGEKEYKRRRPLEDPPLVDKQNEEK